MSDKVTLKDLQDFIQKKHSKYSLKAYLFIDEVFTSIIKLSKWFLNKKEITGKQLARAVLFYSIAKFGLLTRTVLQQLNILTSEDVGTIVFDLVEFGLLRKNDSDKIEDFANVFTLEDLNSVQLKAEDNLFIRYSVTLQDEVVEL